MHSVLRIPRPGISLGSYPQRKHIHEPWPFYHSEKIRAGFVCARAPSDKRRTDFLQKVHAKRAQLASYNDADVADHVRGVRSKLIINGLEDDVVAEAFASISVCFEYQLRLMPHDQQFLAAWLMLDRRLIEMQTGEGKTLAVALAAGVGGLAGTSVHVVTANDYLAERDATNLGPAYKLLGLNVGVITPLTQHELRPEIYQRDIVYCTAKELVFDYLRDQTNSSFNDGRKLNLRGLCMAIIDEADSVLIDEARTPFILSEATPNTLQAVFYRQALFLAAQLKVKEDYVLNPASMSVSLTPSGIARVQHLSEKMGDSWRGRRRREETVSLALAAQHLFLKDTHYLVRIEGGVKQIAIVDSTTGRQAYGRVWSRGLHQLIETKEGCTLTETAQTLKQITFQRFFSRYHHLAGISGTLIEAKGELLAIYGLAVATIPLRKVSLRIQLPSHVFTNKEQQWQYVVERIVALQGRGQPVLVGTDSIYDSEILSVILTKNEIRHTVLNARFDADEANIVAKAGQVGNVTISTNMAGRGTDIELTPEVVKLGGLHIISCQFNHSRRIDRQLYGRCARQGQPGSFEQIYCVEGKPKLMQAIVAVLMRMGGAVRNSELSRRYAILFWIEQRLRQRYLRKEQWFLFLNDKYAERDLALLVQGE